MGCLFAALRAQIVINEVHHSPGDKTSREEFVELFNAGASPADLTGWSLTGGVDHAFAPGTTMAPGGFLVVAQDPPTLAKVFGVGPYVGPFTGRLDGDGDTLVLRNPLAGREDEVDYQLGFPWPTVGGATNDSIELIHPSLDNSLGGSWRSSNPAIGQETILIEANSQWRYRKGTAEASAPADAWRQPGFNDASWSTGAGSIGYGEPFLMTPLADMQNGYTSVFLRRTFEVPDLGEVGRLVLEVQHDDGFIAWINGTVVASANVGATDLPFDGTSITTREDPSYVPFTLPNPAIYLDQGTNVIAIQLLNASIGGSSDAFIDARLIASPTAGSGPTPGRQNTIFAATAPPQLRQATIESAAPVANEPVVISVKATDPDGVASVTLEYQTVDPGAYIRLTDPAYATSWTALDMADTGADGDLAAGDDIYTVTIPASVQRHRRLVRFRLTASDAAGATIRAPYADDPQPNFAYFVYNGVPQWRGASRPGVTPVRTFSPTVLSQLPIYHLIAAETDVIRSQYDGAFENTHFRGTMVYEDAVYDHVEFENRGEFSTYVSGKNKWRFHFLRGHAFQGRDDHGREHRFRYRKMDLSAAATPWVPTNRGMAGIDESIAFRLYDLAGVPSSRTNFFHFRIIDEAEETHPTDQYRGDLWGLYVRLEHPDGDFLDEHGLPDGNTYKIEGGNGDKKNQGPTQPATNADYDSLRAGFGASQPIAWWRANVDLEGFYAFRAINKAINNMDLREGWNHFQYHHPETNRWTAIPWDLDMLYMPLTHWSGLIDFEKCLSHAQLSLEYRNRARELLDLLVNSEQLAQLVAEHAAVVNPPGEPLTMVDVDEAMWNYHPRTASNHRGAFYRNPSTHGAIGGTITRTLTSADHEGMATWIFDFAASDYGQEGLVTSAADTAIPATPVVTAIGAASFPVDDLRFRTSAFADPQGTNTFAALAWRAAAITPPSELLPGIPTAYEIDAAWESGEITTFAAEVQVPTSALRVGGTYRVRARMKDTTGRWSHWSEPVQLVAGAPTSPLPEQQHLRITEVMYHPAAGDDFEFIELKNIGPEPIDLTQVSFAAGVEFAFRDGEVPSLGPDELVVIVSNRAAFTALHGAGGILVAGEYGRNLSNGGERIELVHGAGLVIQSFVYSDAWYPSTDGGGPSLVIVDPEGPLSSWNEAAGWRESSVDGGSPGADEGAPVGGRRLPGDANGDGGLDISDAVRLLLQLFAGGGTAPCDGPLTAGGNLLLLDANGDAALNLTDVVHALSYLFKEGPPPALGKSCVRIEGCSPACGG
jgi:hypothetical protein